MSSSSDTSERLRIADVIRMTGMSRTEIYRRAADGTFPAQYRLGYKRAVWSRHEVQEYLDKEAEKFRVQMEGRR